MNVQLITIEGKQQKHLHNQTEVRNLERMGIDRKHISGFRAVWGSP